MVEASTEPSAPACSKCGELLQSVLDLLSSEIEKLRAEQRKDFRGHRDRTIAHLVRVERKIAGMLT